MRVTTPTAAAEALLGITQQQLGEAFGLSFQQVQKYENGANRISASKLYELCQILHVPVSFFFEGIETKDQSSGHGLALDAKGSVGLSSVGASEIPDGIFIVGVHATIVAQ